MAQPPSSTPKRRQQINSIHVGARILKALQQRGQATSLSKLATLVAMPPAKVHRYLTSMIVEGLVCQTGYGLYDLGPYLLELSTAYLSRLDPTTVANQAIEQLAEDVNEGIILSVWGSAGATVIRWLQSRSPISISIQPGVVLPLLSTASGRIFLAYQPAYQTLPHIQSHLNTSENSHDAYSMAQIRNIIQETRQHGLSRVNGLHEAHVASLAAPIFNFRNQIIMAIALFGFKDTMDVDWQSKSAKALRASSQKISQQLGYVPELITENPSND